MMTMERTKELLSEGVLKVDMLSEEVCIDLIRHTPREELSEYLERFTEPGYTDGVPFQRYMAQYKQEWNETVVPGRGKLFWNDVFEKAGVSNTYGYKLVSGHKVTQKRDTILRLCFACGMSIKQAAGALAASGQPAFRVRNPRDAVLISAFTTGMTDPEEVSRMLEEHGQKALEPCGA